MRAWTFTRGSYRVKIHTLRLDDLTFLYSVTSYDFHIRGMFEGVGVSTETVYTVTRASSYMLVDDPHRQL